MTSAGSFPLTLRVAGRKVVVVGGGHVATRRAHALVDAGADLTVVSPTLTARLTELADQGRITWEQRAYEDGDLDGAWLVQTATADAATDDGVAADAEAKAIWCLKGGDPEAATAWTPAVARIDDVLIAVSGGGDAGRASSLRDGVAAALQAGELPLRHRTHHPEGFVALVGGGPGDSGLLTVRGRRLLAEADVVVVDRLAPTSYLAELAPDVEVIDVGKMPDHHRSRRTRSTASSSTMPSRVASWCGSRAAIRTSSDAVARSVRLVWTPASRSRSCPVSPARSRCRPQPVFP